ncbi:protein YgfX [Xanthomonas floridensis]|uniref:Protein YgfX n=1 Tax=Xanthomonas floridensis TaxID=1843580 RepID=A0A1A9MA94_9XANT|nr:protein YgfX [Xanthomonas floridensis]MEA5125548.1 protein YgfX [Xanthomonas floridensis]MEA5133357.1 protein YgfX [Xanthomonas floridensis]OAG66991.1 hypothetical protein A7D17_19925 [Xanthomonas floridensis]
MPTMPHSSPISAPCRLEWRPSRALACALVLMALLAQCAVWRCGAPIWGALVLSGYAALLSMQSLRRLLRSPLRELVVPWSDAAASVDGERVENMQVCWRGPIAVVSWRGSGSRRSRLHFWPDTLPAAQRRELRLAAQAHAISSRALQVAP